jgi:hypothetical protein
VVAWEHCARPAAHGNPSKWPKPRNPPRFVRCRVSICGAWGLPACAVRQLARRDCTVIDISDDGAQLSVLSVGGLRLKEFFLLLTTMGVAYRRCELAWVNGEHVGMNFISHARGKKAAQNSGSEPFV